MLGDGLHIAREYEKLTSELNEKAPQTLASSDENAIFQMRMQLEQAHQSGNDALHGSYKEVNQKSADYAALTSLREQLHKEEQARLNMEHKLRIAKGERQMQLWRRQPFPAVHSETLELRHRLKATEEMYTRTRSELETSQNTLPQCLVAQASSLPVVVEDV